jgi:metal-responsive CopG/Arc/MetJ family transcriptional regulator
MQITIRIDPNLLDRADALIPYVTGQHGLPAARSDVWREALRRGLRELEQEKKKSKER